MDERRVYAGGGDGSPPTEPSSDEPAAADEPAGDETPAEPVVVGWDTGVQWGPAPSDAPPMAPMPPVPPAGWPAQWGTVDRAVLPPPRGTVRILSVIGRTIDLFLRRPLVFLVLALPTTLVSALGDVVSDTRVTLANPANLSAIFLLGLVAVLVGIVSGLAMIIAADQLRSGHEAGLGSVVGRAFGRFLVAVGSLIVQYLALAGLFIGVLILTLFVALSRSIPLTVIGFIAMAIVIVYVLLRWSLSSAAVALEPVGAVEALGRSNALTKGNLWRIVGLFVLLGLVALPLVVGVAFLSIEATDPLPRILLSAVSALAAAPLFSIASATVFGDLTGRPETPRPAASAPLRGIFVAALLAVGVLALAVSVPGISSALDRFVLQGVPVADRGKIFAGTARNPVDACHPDGVKTTFSTTEPIYIGGYFTKPVPRGGAGKVEIFVNGQFVTSEPLGDPIRAVTCYYEMEPLMGAAPASYKVLVSLDGELLAQGEFTVR